MANFDLNSYETVDSRIKKFYHDYQDGRIITELVSFGDEPGNSRWVVKASIFRTPDLLEPSSTGYAFEIDGQAGANKTSALENCETSAIGRALANLGYSGDKRASREEMAKVAKSVDAPADWQELVKSATTVAELTAIWNQALGEGWMNAEIKAALTARKSEVQ